MARGFSVTQTLDNLRAYWKKLQLAIETNPQIGNAIMRQTNLCPFGGGMDGLRASCQFGHPGCACVDWYTRHEKDEPESEESA